MTDQPPSAPVTEELPDTSMLWRRLISTALSLLLIAIAWRVSERLTEANSLRIIALAALSYAALLSLLYFTGASVLDLTRLLTAFRTKRTILENQTVGK